MSHLVVAKIASTIPPVPAFIRKALGDLPSIESINAHVSMCLPMSACLKPKEMGVTSAIASAVLGKPTFKAFVQTLAWLLAHKSCGTVLPAIECANSVRDIISRAESMTAMSSKVSSDVIASIISVAINGAIAAHATIAQQKAQAEKAAQELEYSRKIKAQELALALAKEEEENAAFLAQQRQTANYRAMRAAKMRAWENARDNARNVLHDRLQDAREMRANAVTMAQKIESEMLTPNAVVAFLTAKGVKLNKAQLALLSA